MKRENKTQKRDYFYNCPKLYLEQYSISATILFTIWSKGNTM